MLTEHFDLNKRKRLLRYDNLKRERNRFVHFALHLSLLPKDDVEEVEFSDDVDSDEQIRNNTMKPAWQSERLYFAATCPARLFIYTRHFGEFVYPFQVYLLLNDIR